MPEPISYTLRFPAPEAHYVEVEARLPSDGAPALDLMMPVWTPGSYLVREFSRNVEALQARDEAGAPLGIVKTAKNRWRVDTLGRARINLHYRVYGREMTVRTNFIDASFALINGAPTFITPVGAGGRPHDVQVIPAASWRTVVSPLPAAPGGSVNTFRAADYDTLVDSPLYAGNPVVHDFEVAGRHHRLVDEGGQGAWDSDRAATALTRIVQEEVAFWGLAPYPHYTFYNLLTEEGGGLEHRDSTVLMSSRFKLRTRDGLLDWLSLACHEFFHAWNVKRLHPAEIDHFDYEREAYTESLWVAEGVTSYYDELLVARAGLMRRDELLKRLSKLIDGLQTGPGRLVQPMGAASFDAWIKYYRKDENFANSGVSYYTKGAVVGLLLDVEIRRATHGAKSLDDAMRLAFQRYSGAHGYTQAQWRAVLSEVAGRDLGPFLAHAVDSAEELDYRPVLDWFGLRFTDYKDEGDKDDAGTPNPEKDREKEAAPKDPPVYLGIETAVEKGRLTVTTVQRDTPAYAAGLNVGDEILAIDDFRVPPAGFRERLKAYRPGDSVSFLVARRERLTRLAVTFGAKPARKWKLEIDPKATAEQREHLTAWLRSSLAVEGAKPPLKVAKRSPKSLERRFADF